MERRREGSAGALMLAVALILTALIAWLLWGMIDARRSGEQPDSAVLVHEEGGAAHG